MSADQAPGTQSPGASRPAAKTYWPGDTYRLSDLRSGTVVYRLCRYRADGRAETPSPCCPETSRRIDLTANALHARSSSRAGMLTSCRGCGWRWLVLIEEDDLENRHARWESFGPPPGKDRLSAPAARIAPPGRLRARTRSSDA